MVDREKDLPEDLTPDTLDEDDLVYEDIQRRPGENIEPDSVRPAPGVDEDGNALDPERLEDILKGE